MNAVKIPFSGLVLVVTCWVSSATLAQQTSNSNRQSTPAANNQRNGGGLLNRWLGGGSSAPKQNAASANQDSLLGRLTGEGKSSDDKGRRVIEPAPQTTEPDWSGVPFHKPAARATTANNSQPIQDPSDPSNRVASLARPTATSKPISTPPAVNSNIPRPPAEVAGNVSPRRTTAATPAAAGVAAPQLNTNTYEPLSSTDSSRRSNRKTVSPLEANVASPSDMIESDGSQGNYTNEPLVQDLNSRATAPAAAPTEALPRVARRSLPSAPLKDTLGSMPAPARTIAADTPPSLSLPAATALPANDPWTVRGDAEKRTATNTTAAAPIPPASTPSIPPSSPPRIGQSNNSATTNGLQASPAATSGTASTRPATGNSTTGNSTTTSTAAIGNPISLDPPARPESFAVTPRVDNGNRTPATTNTAVVNSLQASGGNEIPGLRVVTTGPAEIAVNQVTPYQITLENRGTLDAPGAMVQIAIPAWVTIHGQTVTRGEIEKEENAKSQELLWLTQGLAAGTKEVLTLQLSAVEAKAFDVGVEFALVPQASSSRISVMEPKLELLIEGPDQVVFGESQTYKVRVMNPGSGVAEGIVFTLSPNSATPQTQRIGNLPPGKEAQFEVELSAQDMESLQIHGLASGDLGLKNEKTKVIQVIAAQLEAILSGPALQYQDSQGTYQLELTNHGLAECRNVMAVLQLPAGVVYKGGVEGAVLEGGRLRWQIDQLAPNATKEYSFQCQLQKTGEQQFAFECQGSASGTASVSFATQVDAIADLVLTINDPPAPAPVGTEVVYEVIIRNRGSKAASDVEASAKFGFDIEPVRIDGAPGKIEPGLVYFEKIARIEPGAEIKLRVFAKAEKPGLHGFRTEVRCGDTLLVSEESTRYMQMVGEHISRRSDNTKLR